MGKWLRDFLIKKIIPQYISSKKQKIWKNNNNVYTFARYSPLKE